MIYNVEVNNRIIRLVSIKNEDGENVSAVGGNKGDEVRFTIYGDLNRADAPIKAAFLWNGKYHLEDLIEIDAMQGLFYCYAPPIFNSNNFYLGLYIGEDSDETPYLSTNKVEIPCKLSIRDYIKAPQDSHLGKYTDVLAFYAERAENAATNAENSEKEACESAKSAGEDAERAEAAAIRAEAYNALVYVDALDGIVKYDTLEEAKNNVGTSRNAEILQAAIDSGSNLNLVFGKGYYPFEKEIGLHENMALEGVIYKTTLVFPNSKGLVTNKKGYFHRMIVKSLCIHSDGNCIDFKNDGVNFPNSVYWSEFNGLDLHSENGCCIYAGDNKGCDGLDAMVFQCKFRNLFNTPTKCTTC